jgi:hypothetical protein
MTITFYEHPFSPMSTRRWNDVPRGTMDEVSSHVRLNPTSV